MDGVLLYILAIILASIIFIIKRQLNYFKDSNVSYLKSFPILGALADTVVGKKGIFECVEDIYRNPEFKNEKFFGIFMFHKPALMIKDRELIKQILVKDFTSFSNHVGGAGQNDPLGNSNLFMAKDALWKNLRRKLSPVFSSGKIKAMFPIIDEIGDNLLVNIDEIISQNQSAKINIKHKFSLYITDVIASCAFGVDSNALKNPDGDFVKFGERLFGFTPRRAFEFLSQMLLPELVSFFNIKAFTDEGNKFIMKTIPHVMKERELTKTCRNDLIDALIQIKNDQLKDNDDESLSLETLVAQAGLFFLAGQETSSTIITFLLFELAKQENIQERVRKEMQLALEKNNGKLTYDTVMHETPYLHQVFYETLRLYPTLSFLDRECSNPNGYSLEPYSNFVVPYKMPVFIPIYSMQRDEKYFPNPLKFDPDRFSPENAHDIDPYIYLPFGTGNRNCIGYRFALMQLKSAAIKILTNYRVEMTDETPKEISLKKQAFVIQSDVPIVLRLVRDKLEI